jgi:malate dehydrogenase (oxaloacetate-decarboxylating)
MAGADVFVGVSGPGLVTPSDVARMADQPIVFALANPDPEIMPELTEGLVAVMATGRSDYPNQINNVLAFPGIFRGVLDAGARHITDSMKLAAATAIAEIVSPEELSPEYVVPSVFDRRVAPAVAQAVMDEAKASGQFHPTEAPADPLYS